MSFFLENTWMDIFLLLTTTIVMVSYFHNSYQYWIRRGVPTVPPKFPLGNNNTFIPLGLSIGTLSKQFYDYLKKQGHKFGGVYLLTTPNLVLVDPDHIKDILMKDFQYFADRGIYYNKRDDFLSAQLLSVDAREWKSLRVKLTPTFTSGRMKTMFHSVVRCCENLIQAIDRTSGGDINTKETMCRYTTDVIGSVAFGIDCNSFKDPDAEFCAIGKKHFTYRLWKSLRAFVLINLPNVAKKLRLRVTTGEVRTFFRTLVEETVKTRQETKTRRNDFLQILIDLNQECNFTLEEMAAQAFSFFIAGFDTSSTIMTFALYELARNPEIQKKVRSEVRQVLEKHNGQLTYENLNEMTYMQQVFDETARMYPPLATLNRRCIKEYTLRGTNIVLEEGTPVLIPVLGLHMDPEYYPEPEKFDPERFNEENKKDRRFFVYLPFGDGPRNCIGLRFGLMQIKIGIAMVVNNFQISLSPIIKPVELNPFTFVLNSKSPVYLRAERL